MKDFLKQPLAVRCGVGDAETKVEMTALDAQSVQFAVQEPEGAVVSMQLAGTMETLGAALERGAEIKVKLPGCVFEVSFDLEADKTVIPYMVRPIEPEIDIPERFEGTWC